MDRSVWDDDKNSRQEHDLFVVDKSEYDQAKQKIAKLQQLIEQQEWFSGQEKKELDKLIGPLTY